MTKRQCGECTVCCSVKSVVEIEKPAHETCSKVCAGGCTIYGERPQSCRDYQCLWLVAPEINERLAELVRDDDRPDKSGVLLDAPDPTSDFTQTTGILMFSARPAVPGAIEGYRGQKLLTRLARRFAIRVFKSYDLEDNRGSISGPAETMGEVQAYIAARER